MFEALEMRTLLAADLPSVASALVGAIHHQDLFTTVLERNDDSSSQLTPLGFTVDFFGREFSGVYVNNNGNVSFNAPLSTYTAFSLLSTEIPLLAPFFADVDTRDSGSDLVRYGHGMIDGRKVFGVNWIDVGYFSGHSDKLNSFQLIITSRSDIAAGDFDFEFNYDAIRWETGDASDGSNGFGGSPARAGWSNGTNRSLELPGSAENGALLDEAPNSLVAGSVNSTQPGRYLFEVRAGAVATNPLTVAIGSTTAALVSGQTANLSFTLSEPSTTFTRSDVIVTGGTLSNFAGSGVNYSAIFTPQAGFEGVGNVRVATGAFTNARGIPNLAGRLQLAIDTLAPTVAISSNRTIVRAAQTAMITFTLSSPSTTFTAEDVVVTGGALSNFSRVNGSSTLYTATFTPTPAFSGSGTVRVPQSRFADAAGNVNTAEATLAPAIQIATNEWVTAIMATRDGQPIDVLKAGQTATLTFTFSEPVLGFTASDITVAGGTLSGFTGSDKTYTAVFTPRPNSITPGTVRIAANRYTDTLGNPNELLQLSPSIAINTVIPAMTIAQRIPVLKAGQSTTVTFQIRGTVNTAGPNPSPFELSDISLAPNQGSVSSLTSLGVNRGVHTYTAVYTAPSGSFGGPVSLTVPANSFRVIGNDVNGNAAASLSINVDAQGPATVLSTTAQALTIGQTATIDFTIANETANVVGFEAADVSLSSGTISAPTRVPGTNVYRATYTPAANVEGPVTIALAAGKFTDAIGNPNSLANSITIAVDTKAPASPVVSLLSDTGSSSVDKITSDARLQTTGTETNAAVQYWANPGLTTPWTPAAAVQGSNTAYVTQTDVAGNRSTATAFAFEYRTAGPAVTAITLPAASTGLVAGRFVELKVTFARPVFVSGDNTSRPFIQIGGFTTGDATRRAVYASGSGTTTLVFRYQVQAGDKALTGIIYPSSSIVLEGATIRDAADNAASLTFTLPSRRPVTRINA
jgi:hypothetical protein